MQMTQNFERESLEWSEKWQLRFHPNKCKVMRLGRPKEQTREICL